jgi:hypothetical protein
MYFIDSWDNERFVVSADRFNTFISTKDNSKAKNICNGSFKSDNVRLITAELAHTGSEVTITLEDFLDEAPDN